MCGRGFVEVRRPIGLYTSVLRCMTATPDHDGLHKAVSPTLSTLAPQKTVTTTHEPTATLSGIILVRRRPTAHAVCLTRVRPVYRTHRTRGPVCEHDHEKQQLLLLELDPALPPTCSRELPPASCSRTGACHMFPCEDRGARFMSCHAFSGEPLFGRWKRGCGV